MLSSCMPTSAGVCVHTNARNQVRGCGGQIGRGQWGSECMLGAALCVSRELKRERETWRKTREGGVCQSRPCGKTPQEEEEDMQQAAREQY